jgi:hypothetical protein
MAVKKLSIKKSSTGKLKIHKTKPVEEEQEELELEEQEDEVLEEEEVDEDEELEEEEDEIELNEGEAVDEDTGEIYVEGQMVGGRIAVINKAGELILEEFEEVAEVKHGAGPMANIGYGLDRTINLGNYESLKIHVTIHVPSIVSEEEIEGNYEFCKGWTEMKMAEVTKEYTEEPEEDDIPF